MEKFIALILSRSRAALLLFGFILIWGTLSYIKVPKESTPDVQIPILYVSLSLDGISPQDSERLLVRPVEQQLRTIEGVKKMTSTAFEGGGFVLLKFNAGYSIDKARNYVREKVNIAKSYLPAQAKEPTITEVNLSLFPILLVKLSGNIPDRTLYRLARNLSDRIESSVSAVLKARVVGSRDDVVEVLVNPLQLQNYPLTFDQLIAVFDKNNQIIPAGRLENKKGNFAVKVPALFEDVEDIKNIPLLANGEATIQLKDVAEIRRTFEDPEGFARDQGVDSVVIEISKRLGENLIDTVAAVREVVATEQKEWPSQLSVSYAQDESHNMKEMLTDLQNNIISAILLVMLVMSLTLGRRSALLVGLAVPGSFLMGVLLLVWLGYTVNVVVLFSLIFSVGMLVDGAIIIVEYADRRLAEGASRSEAYKDAAIRMAWPVITSTLTILVVFMPLLFWPGVTGQFMKYLPITLIAVLFSSIIAALVFVPVIGSFIAKRQDHAHELHLDTLASLTQLEGWTKSYVEALKRALKIPFKIILSAVGVLVGVIILYTFLGKGTEFFPDIEPDTAMIQIHGRGNLSVHEKDTLVRSVEKRILDMKELRSIYTRVGSQPNGNTAPDVIGAITFEFVDWRERRKANEIMEEMRKRTKDIAGIKVEVVKPNDGPSDGKPIQIEVSAVDLSKLDGAATQIRRYLDHLPGLTGIEDDRALPGIAWEIQVDRSQASKFGVDMTLIGNAIKLITNGLQVAKYRPDDVKDEVNILVRYHPEFRALSELDKLRITTPRGVVPLSNFIKKAAKPQLTTINRVDGKRVLTIQSDVLPNVLVTAKVAEIQKWLKEKPQKDLQKEVQITFKGQEEDQAESSQFLLNALFAAIFLITIVLVLQFNSFFSAALVLSSVVLSIGGVFVGLMIHCRPFGIVMGGIGFIALAGIIVSNNIILIDTYDKLMETLKEKREDISLAQIREVILLTCAQRLRPVILTKLTTILGLLPILFAINIDFVNLSLTVGAPATQWWTTLATCIVYGVLFASSLTLFVTPCALMMRANRWAKKGKIKAA